MDIKTYILGCELPKHTRHIINRVYAKQTDNIKSVTVKENIMETNENSTQENTPTQTDKQAERQARIMVGVNALLNGSHSLYITPIENSAGWQTNRLPLLTWLQGTDAQSGVIGRYFVLGILKEKMGLSFDDIALALRHIESNRLAYIDTEGCRIVDVKEIAGILADAYFKRCDGRQTTALDTQAKIYVRDLKQVRATKGKKRKPVVMPKFMNDLLASTKETTPLSITVGGESEDTPLQDTPTEQ